MPLWQMRTKCSMFMQLQIINLTDRSVIDTAWCMETYLLDYEFTLFLIICRYCPFQMHSIEGWLILYHHLGWSYLMQVNSIRYFESIGAFNTFYIRWSLAAGYGSEWINMRSLASFSSHVHCNPRLNVIIKSDS